eukprot:35747-Chlamydomonas_euryale.AAC.1
MDIPTAEREEQRMGIPMAECTGQRKGHSMGRRMHSRTDSLAGVPHRYHAASAAVDVSIQMLTWTASRQRMMSDWMPWKSSLVASAPWRAIRYLRRL